MPEPPIIPGSRPLLARLDPRRSLMAAVVCMVVALAAAFSIAASLWVGGLARDIVFQQHVRRLSLETDQLAANVAAAVRARLAALRISGALLPAGDPAVVEVQLRQVFDRLVQSDPEADWLGIADLSGRVLAMRGVESPTGNVAEQAWFRAGKDGVWLGVMDASGSSAPGAVAASGAASASGAAGASRAVSQLGGASSLGAASASPSSATSTLGDFAAPVRNAAGAIIGVIAAKLSWRAGTRAATDPDSGRDPLAGQPLLLDRGGLVLAGPPSFLGRKWAGEAVLLDGDDSPGPPRFETLAEGRRYLITRAAVQIGEPAPRGGWLVQLAESTQRVYERADALAARIVWVSVCLGALTALAGALGAQRLTGRLQRLTRSVGDVRRHGDGALEVPAGDDEAAQLGVAFAGMLADLRQERSDLRALSSELERRVAVRSREVERLAEESRYAAVVRERLKIARDLHDTLAHSMMAMLSEIRILRRLEAHDPASLADELARAEQVALEGLNEARTAINQMRVNAVRDTGLGAALSKTLAAFGDETGLPVNFTTDADAARFGDERAETVYRMAGEALRNIARHARARRVEVSLLTGEGTRCELRIADDGVGFDPGARYEGHFGLIGLREQAELIGAALAIESSSERGTTLTIAWKTSPEEL